MFTHSPPTPVVLLRPARLEDAATILALIHELAAFEKLSHEVTATPEAIAHTLFGPNPAAQVILAEQQHEGAMTVVGFCLYFTSYSTFLAKPGIYLEDLFVKPAARSQGIGRMLLKELARIALARNYERIEWSVLRWNERAIQFYESLGAKPQQEWQVYRLTGGAIESLAQSKR